MHIPTKPATIAALITGALALTACGDMIDKEQLYEEFASTCSSEVVEQGLPAEVADQICECSANKAREQELGPMDMLDQEKMTAIGEECAAEALELM